MPLVYPPNFEGVRLTYEFVGAYILYDYDTDINEAVPITLATANVGSFLVEPQNLFFYLETVNDSLRIRGFVNTNN